MLVDIEIPSIYNDGPLPRAMARCAPDTRTAILALAQAVKNRGGQLRLSDLFRSHDQQLQAHQDWLNGRKRAYSAPPGGSMHEAGRAMDIDLEHINMRLAEFWKLAARCGFTPLIGHPDSKVDEAWHFDHRGSHGAVYDYVKAGHAGPRLSPYTQMSASAILAAGIPVDCFSDQRAASIQAGLIRLGRDPGPIDGSFGPRTRAALAAFGSDPERAMNAVDAELRLRWPQEFAW